MDTQHSNFSDPRSPLKSIAATKKVAKQFRKTGAKAAQAQRKKAFQLKKRQNLAKGFQLLKEMEEREKDKFDEIKPHQVYQDTYYYPNNRTKVFEVAIISNLPFQILLYFNFFFCFLFFLIILATSVVKMWMYSIRTNYLPLIAVILWLPFELSRIFYGYKGNIQSTFPQLIAFLIFSLFSIACLFLLWTPEFLFPCEISVLSIQTFFVIIEFVIGTILICKYMAHSSAIFFLRGQTMLDRDLQMYHSMQTIKTSREVELGLKKATEQTRRAQGIFKKKIDEILSQYTSEARDGLQTPYSRITSARFTRDF